MKPTRRQANQSPAEPEAAVYDAWIKHVFDRPEDAANRWYFKDDDVEFPATPDVRLRLLHHTLRRCGQDLSGFSDEQLTAGFNYIFCNHASDVVTWFTDKTLQQTERDSTVLAIKWLYSDCFAPRCSQALSHLNQPGSSLNGFCYMLWDVSPLGDYNATVAKVMQHALTLPNIACTESALHGLGHYCGQNPTLVRDIIDQYLSSGFHVRPELRQYALQARTGLIL